MRCRRLTWLEIEAVFLAGLMTTSFIVAMIG